MAADAALPGLLLCFAATVLLIFTCVSAPTWNAIYFLSATFGGETIHFGWGGFTGSNGVHVGYSFTDALPQLATNHRLSEDVIRHLTGALVLQPISAGLAGLATLFGICGASYHRTGTIMMSITAVLATLSTLVAWVIDMALFGIVRDQVKDNGGQAMYGNATWMTLGALVALILGGCAGLCGVFGRYRRKRSGAAY